MCVFVRFIALSWEAMDWGGMKLLSKVCRDFSESEGEKSLQRKCFSIKISNFFTHQSQTHSRLSENSIILYSTIAKLSNHLFMTIFHSKQ
jgi:hypothetical protein